MLFGRVLRTSEAGKKLLWHVGSFSPYVLNMIESQRRAYRYREVDEERWACVGDGCVICYNEAGT